MIHKNCLIGWLDTQIEKAEKENKTEMIKAYTNVLNLIYNSNALKKIEYLEYVDKNGNNTTITPIQATVLNQYKIRIREM